jgi:hypothetical protein
MASEVEDLERLVDVLKQRRPEFEAAFRPAVRFVALEYADVFGGAIKFHATEGKDSPRTRAAESLIPKLAALLQVLLGLQSADEAEAWAQAAMDDSQDWPEAAQWAGEEPETDNRN